MSPGERSSRMSRAGVLGAGWWPAAVLPGGLVAVGAFGEWVLGGGGGGGGGGGFSVAVPVGGGRARPLADDDDDERRARVGRAKNRLAGRAAYPKGCSGFVAKVLGID